MFKSFADVVELFEKQREWREGEQYKKHAKEKLKLLLDIDDEELKKIVVFAKEIESNKVKPEK